MRHSEQISRYEVNRQVRMVITRHDGDLTQLDYSFLGKSVYLSGSLSKPNRDFAAKEIQSIATDIMAIPDVKDIIFDLNNWIVESSGNAWQVKPLRKPGKLIYTSGPATGSSEDATHVIEKADKLESVLDDINKDLSSNSK